MADNGQIKHTDIAEVGVLKPLQDELIATIKIINTMDADLVSIAKSLKKALSDGTNTSTEAMKKLTEQAKLAKDAFVVKEELTKKAVKANNDLSVALSEESKEIAKVVVQTQELNKETKISAKLASDQIGAYEKADITLKQLIKDYKNLAIVQKENSAEGKVMKKQIDELSMTLKSVDASVGIHTRNVGNYGHSFNGLSNSINQVTREMPAFVNSAQTGFMAISNNLPMLIDQIGLLKQRNAELNAEGKQGVPVWKSVASALFSWQTLMGVGITLMVTYGKEIGNAIKGLFGYKDATEQAKLMQKEFNDEMQISIERIDEIARGQQQQIDFDTQALLINAKKRGATLKELRDIEEQGRNKQYKSLVQNADNLYLAASKAGDDLIKLKGSQNKEAIDAQQSLYDKLLKDAHASENAAEKLRLSNVIKKRQEELDDIDSARKLASEARKKAMDDKKKEYDELLKELDSMYKKAKDLETDYLKALYDQRKKQEEELPKLVDTVKIYHDSEQKLFDIGRKNREKARKEEAKKEADLMRSATNILENTAKKQLQITNNKIDREVQANQRRQQDLRELSLKGVQDANNNLAFEERKQAELESKRMKAQKNAKKQEILFAGLKAYSANVERNPNTALMTTLKDLTLLTSALSSLPTFLEGTENIAKSLGKPQLKGKDGYIVRVDGDERVLNPEQNKKIGNLTNEELTNLAEKKNKGLIDMTKFISVPMANAYNDNLLISETSRMNKNLEDMKVLLKNMPTQTIQYDELAKISTEIIRSEHRVISTSKKIGGLRG